jgi:hypothetical protein
MKLKSQRVSLLFLLMVPFGTFAQGPKTTHPRTLEGTVVGKEEGPRWTAIVVESGGTKYVVPLGQSPSEFNPTTIGDVEAIGARVRVIWRKLERRRDGALWVDALRVMTIENQPSLNGDKDWNTFWQAFRTAVRSRDRKTLKAMMSTEFEYIFMDKPPGDPRNNAFQYFDKYKKWISLDKVLAQGVVYSQGYSKQSKRNTYVSPPAANAEEYYGYRALFELGADGRWRWVAFVSGD